MYCLFTSGELVFQYMLNDYYYYVMLSYHIISIIMSCVPTDTFMPCGYLYKSFAMLVYLYFYASVLSAHSVSMESTTTILTRK